MATEKRLIDANALKDAFCSACSTNKRYQRTNDECRKYRDSYGNGCFKMRIVDESTTVDAVEVVHGRWLYGSGSGKHFCSACDEYALSFNKDTIYGGELYEVCLTDYCPNCGAKMDGDGNG